MTTTKITDSETASLKISSLPTRPTAPSNFGGKGYTAAQMKAAFDALPMLLVSRFNALLDDLAAAGDDSVAGVIRTGLAADHTLADLFTDIGNGNLAARLSVDGKPLTQKTAEYDAALTGIVVTSSAASVLLEHGKEYRSTASAALGITFPAVPDTGYYAMLSFTTGSAAMSFTYPKNKIAFSGDSISAGYFIPEKKTHYTLLFWYDGSMQCVVRGVSV